MWTRFTFVWPKCVTLWSMSDCVILQILKGVHHFKPTIMQRGNGKTRNYGNGMKMDVAALHTHNHSCSHMQLQTQL